MAWGPAEGNAGADRAAPYKAGAAGGVNLFVGGLPMDSKFTEEELTKVFSPFGSIQSCKVLRDYATKVGKGCGFVMFATQEEADKAIEGVNSQGEYQVKLADNGQAKGQGKQKGKGIVAFQNEGGSLYVKNIPKSIDQHGFEEAFRKEGFTVERSKLLLLGEDAEGNAGLITLGSPDEAAKSIEKMNGKPLPGTELALEVKLKDGPGKGGGAYEGAKDNLFIMGLPVGCDQATCESLFTSAGFTVVRSKLIPAKDESHTWSAAMVQLSSADEASNAIVSLNGTQPEGYPKPLQVTLSQGKGGKGDGKGAVVPKAKGPMTLTVRYHGGHDQAACDNLFICGLPSPQIDLPTLNALFGMINANIVRAKVLPDTNWKGSSAAMVQVESQEIAAEVIKALNGQTMTCEEIRQSTGVTGNTLTVKYQGADETPSANLFISGLPSPQVNQAVLERVFTDLGLTVIRSKPLPDTRGTGHSQALVQVASEEEAKTAIALMNGEVFPEDEAEATPLSVKYQGHGEKPSDNLYISGLPSPQVDEAALRSVFEQLGHGVVQFKAIPDTRNVGTSVAMVRLSSQEEAAAAIEALHGQVVPGLAAAKSAGWDEGKGKGKQDGKGSWDAPSWGGWQGAKGGDSWGASAGSSWSKGGNAWSAGAAKGGDAWSAGAAKGGGAWSAGAGSWGGAGGWGGDSWKGADSWGGADDWSEAGMQQQLTALISLLDAKGSGKDKGKGKKAQEPEVQPGHLTVKFAGSGQPSDNLYIAGLPGSSLELADLTSLMEKLQFTVKRAKVIADTKGTGTCVAMVQVASVEEAQWAVENMSGMKMNAEDLAKAIGKAAGAPAAAAAAAAAAPARAAQAAAPALTPAKRPAPEAEPAVSSGPLNVRYAGQKGDDGKTAPSDYLTVSGFAAEVPSEGVMKTALQNIGVTFKRMRVMKGQVMVQVGSKEEAAKAIEELNGWPFPEFDEPWPEE